MSAASLGAAALIRAAPTEALRPWPRHLLTAEGWAGLAAGLAADPTLDLLALWADTGRVHALFAEAGGGVLPVAAPVADGAYAALSPARPAAAWFERMVHDLWGHVAQGGRDLRPWLDHGLWDTQAPMGLRPTPRHAAAEPPEFLAAEGEDLHQIPVGPIHAGIIEPGHFRITAQGETIVRLEVRLGYAHKGSLVMMRGKTPRVAARYAARLSGDSTVAHSWAYAAAVEAALGVDVPPRAVALRAVMAELERVAMHLGDIGAIVGDAAFAVLPARFGLLREAMLRAATRAFGHRLMMDAVVPGGVAVDLDPEGPAAIRAALAAMEGELGGLLALYDGAASLADRLIGTGVLAPALAARHAVGGPIGRASGRGCDARITPGYPPYDRLDFSVPVLEAGDADARVRLRWAELRESAAMLRSLLATLPAGPITAVLPTGSGEGLGVVEGFRGDIWHWVRLDGGLVAAAFARDPSWLQWPVLEAAVAGAVVADFPLCNRSFGCSYSGIDL